ncbi:hypothetical protein PCE1_004604 [Barthelona sp. PCE]
MSNVENEPIPEVTMPKKTRKRRKRRKTTTDGTESESAKSEVESTTESGIEDLSDFSLDLSNINVRRRKTDRRKRTTKKSDKAEVEANNAKIRMALEEEYNDYHARIYELLEKQHPHKTGDVDKISVPLPRVKAVSKKTYVENFARICSALNRPQTHLQAYFETEFSTTSSIDSEGRLILRAKKIHNRFQKVLTAYVLNFVQCPNCSAANTDFENDPKRRLMMISCNNCGAKHSVNMTTK